MTQRGERHTRPAQFRGPSVVRLRRGVEQAVGHQAPDGRYGALPAAPAASSPSSPRPRRRARRAAARRRRPRPRRRAPCRPAPTAAARRPAGAGSRSGSRRPGKPNRSSVTSGRDRQPGAAAGRRRSSPSSHSSAASTAATVGPRLVSVGPRCSSIRRTRCGSSRIRPARRSVMTPKPIASTSAAREIVQPGGVHRGVRRASRPVGHRRGPRSRRTPPGPAPRAGPPSRAGPLASSQPPTRSSQDWPRTCSQLPSSWAVPPGARTARPPRPAAGRRRRPASPPSR